MDRRKEARFQVYAPAKVAPLDEPDREIDAQVIDISGLGLRLITDVELPQDQIIVVETDQHLILADVRNCEPRGAKFGIGAERIHSAAKLSLAQAGSKTERNQALVEAYHRRLSEELPSPSAPSVAAVPAPQLQSVPMVAEPAVAAGALSLQLNPRKPPEVKVDSLQNLAFAVKPRTVPSDLRPIQVEAKATTEGAILVEEPPAAEAEPAALLEPPAVEPAMIEPSLVDPHDVEPPARIPPDEPSDLPRAFLAIDSIEPQSPSRTKHIVLAAVCVVLALAVIVFGPLAKRTLVPAPVAAKNHVGAVAKLPAKITAAPAKQALVQKPPPAPPAEPPAASKSTVAITATDRSWLTACSDGKVVLNKLLTSGDHETLEFGERAIVRVGNAAPIQVQLNGKSIGPIGRYGQLRAISITPDSWSFLKLHDPDGCTQ
ncbi:MAG TPA: RodZ domain-containing protein [Bryobacteraceae bacterium]|nr:RodZ domain-containing protein [Bryobacteraceae bacterium]